MRWIAIVFALFATACVATPLPEPPSADPSLMTLSAAGQADVRLTGRPGAIRLGGAILRVTTERGRGEVRTAIDGAFDIVVTGGPTDRLFLEALEATRDRFLVALTAGASDGPPQVVDPGPDRDGDESPDAIDCAPDDPSLTGGQCTAQTCTVDADCLIGDQCDAGICVRGPTACSRAELCGNGIDDDCDGSVDEPDCT